MKKIEIENIRNIGRLNFEIPAPGVHVVTGENGSGKTTLFTCISRIADKNAYRSGFPTSSSNTLDIFSGSITYAINDNSVTYTRRSSGEWRPNKRDTGIFQEFGYPAVINITTKDKRIFSQDVIIPRRRVGADEWINAKMNTIFNTEKFANMVRFTTGDMRGGRGNTENSRRRNIAFAIPLGHNRYYTEQNFSFGEIVMVNMLYDLGQVENNTLLLIDELELALHPAAQIRLMHSLRELALEKGLTILVSTHSSSIIKAERSVIYLEKASLNVVHVIYDCPPAKAIGAIGMREDTNPDIIILVEDAMAKAFYFALQQKYLILQNSPSYLDVRILEIGGFDNVVNFYTEIVNYVFYDNVYVAAFMDKDVETDVIPYQQFGNGDTIDSYRSNASHLHFLPYTPEVFLIKVFYNSKRELIQYLAAEYGNQQLQYDTAEVFDFHQYEQPLPEFENQAEYNAYISNRGQFRTRCKKQSKRIAESIASQLNQSTAEVYRIVFKFAIEQNVISDVNVRQLLAQTLKRID